MRAHRLDDFRVFVGHERCGLELVVVKIDSHAQHWTPEAVPVRRIEVEVNVAVAVEAAMDAAAFEIAQIVVANGFLPLGAPFRRSFRDRSGFNGPAIGLHLAEVSAAYEAMRTMVEIVAVEFVDAHADRA